MADGAEDIVSRRTRGLDRAFEILEFLRTKRQPMRPNEIAVEIGWFWVASSISSARPMPTSST